MIALICIEFLLMKDKQEGSPDVRAFGKRQHVLPITYDTRRHPWRLGRAVVVEKAHKIAFIPSV